MTVTFLAHSGFFVELETCCLLFDWWKGDLPEGGGKPLFCFVSHRHHDHFTHRIFALDNGSRAVTFLLSHDILLAQRRLARWGVSPETAGKCVSLPADARWDQGGVSVETLRSTDEGVAFLVTAEGKTIYHAGDLNWWHWAGEDPAWNRSMEVDFKRRLEPLRGRAIDLAMVPLDPRLGESEDWGLAYLLELARVQTVLPM
ncbi:MAG: MBL fold metallo-hydrolase, partial [Oscillibacter sp.]